jgi:lipoyltransferase/lipoate-protein ligase
MSYPRVFHLLSNNVFKNLAAEEAIFNALPRGTSNLLFYVNAPAVVIGRTQNPFNEVDISAAESQSVPIARRRSGGGTVVHDEGNLNFSFMGPRATHDPKKNAQLIVRVLRERFNLCVNTTDRGDIFFNGLKVSGAAYRITSDRAYHHGTLLVHSDLPRLRNLLHSPLRETLCVSGAASVRSPVANLADAAQGIDIPSIKSAIAEEYLASFDTGEEHRSSHTDEVESLTAESVRRIYPSATAEHCELSSESWVYGQIPRFSFIVPSKADDARSGSADRARRVLFMSKGGIVDAVKRFDPSMSLSEIGPYSREGFGDIDQTMSSLLVGRGFGSGDRPSSEAGLSEESTRPSSPDRDLLTGVPNRWVCSS